MGIIHYLIIMAYYQAGILIYCILLTRALFYAFLDFNWIPEKR